MIAEKARCGFNSNRLSRLVKRSSVLVFLGEMLSKPAHVGAVWPSSPQLADGMASLVPEGDGLVIELGGGTGAVTKALLDRGISPDRLLVVERSPVFVRHLRQRFPGIMVQEGDAAELSSLVPGSRPVDAIVSSLPLRSLPPTVVTAIVREWQTVIADGGVVVQFTYAIAGIRPVAGFLVKASRIIWSNLPPARIMAFRRAAEPAAAE